MKIIINKYKNYTYYYKNLVLITFYNNIDLEKLYNGIENKNYDNINIYGSFIYIKNNSYIIYTDKQLSFPLYYDKNIITDDISMYSHREIDNTSIEEFKNSNYGYVLGNKTFYKNIYQTLAGNYVEISEKNINAYNYIQLKETYNNYKCTDIIPDLDKIVNKIIMRLIEYADNKKIFLSLSSGYDSKLILLKLKELKYNNIVAYSFGKKANYESTMAKKLCNSLNIEYLFIENIYNYTEINNVFNYHKFSPYTPRFLFYPSLKYIINTFNINDILFTSGIGGDFITGRYNLNSDIFYRKLYNIDKININNEKDFILWNLKELQSKFRNQHTNMYQFFDLNYFLPYYDNEYINFWLNLPYILKKNQYLYKKYIGNLVIRLNTKLFRINKINERYNNTNEDYYIFNLGTKNEDFNYIIKNSYIKNIL